MKSPIIVFVFFQILFFSCEDPRDSIRFPGDYTWKDSIWTYEITRQELIIRPAEILYETRWRGSVVLYDTTNDWFISNSRCLLEFKNGEMHIPAEIPDSINLKNVLPRFYGLPYDGVFVFRCGRGYCPVQEVTFISGKQNKLSLLRKSLTDSIRIIPSSLLNGEDSAYFRKKAFKFCSDSLGMSHY